MSRVAKEQFVLGAREQRSHWRWFCCMWSLVAQTEQRRRALEELCVCAIPPSAMIEVRCRCDYTPGAVAYTDGIE